MNIPERIGPYLIDDVLGQGGMGVVYRARRAETGERCAVKTLGMVAAKRAELLRREIRALGRVRHPGIVRVLDQGIHDGCPWYAMELLNSVTLAHLFATQWAGRASWLAADSSMVTRGAPFSTAISGNTDERMGLAPAGAAQRKEVLSALLRVCPALASLHGEGLVHCDLKPSNVFLRDDGSPVIGDFGLAAHAIGARSRDVLEVSPLEVRGTCAYMAPEQIRGEPLDARSDLYALGCMLFEAVTGRPPFVGSVSDVIAGHLDAQPPALSDLAADVPEALGAVINRLLAKQPRSRIGYADDVAIMLSTATGVELPPADYPPPRPYVYRSALVGRDVHLRRLLQRVSEARRGEGRVVFLGGESGAGKTRLATEAGQQAASLGMLVITGECSAPTVGRAAAAPIEPLLPLLECVADLCTERGAEATRRLLGDRGPILATFEPSLGAVPGADSWLAPARLEPSAARRRLFDALLETVRALSAEQRLLLILDDLQWADELTLAFLTDLLPRLSGMSLLVIGTYRTEQVSATLRDLLMAPSAERLDVGRLDTASVASMVADMLAMSDPPEPFITFLAHEGEGNPFFVGEYVRGAIAARVLSRDETGQWELAPLFAVGEDTYKQTVGLPGGLRDVVAIRLNGLSSEARTVLQMAAVLGREFDGEALEAIVPLSLESTMDATQELVARQVLERANGRLQFLHHLLTEISYEETPLAIRVDGHRRAAAAIEERAGGTLDVAMHATLARHWSLAEQPDRALEHYQSAAARAAEVYANSQAIDYYRLALFEWSRLPDQHRPAPGGVHEGLGDVLALTGRQSEARESYAAALEDSRGPLHAAALERKIGKTWETHHEHAQALAAYDRAIEALGDTSPGATTRWWETWIRVHLDKALVYYWRGTPDLMEQELVLVRPHIDRAPPALHAGYYHALAHVGFRRERYLLSAETVGYARRMVEAALASDDQLLIGETLFDRGFAELFHGDTAAATHTLHRAWEHAERTGDVTRIVRSLTYLTICHRRSRHIEAVEAYARQCLETAQESASAVYIGTSQANLAWADFSRGRYPEAEERCRSALAFWRQIDAAFPFCWLAALPLLAIRLMRRDFAEANRMAHLLLGPEQQRLPEGLTAALDEALGAARDRRGADVRASLAQAVGLARETGYL